MDTYDSVPVMGLLSISEIKVYDRKVSLELDTVYSADVKARRRYSKTGRKFFDIFEKIEYSFHTFSKIGGIFLFSLETPAPSGSSSVPREVP